MASINTNTLTEPIYVRLTLEIAEEIRKQAIRAGANAEFADQVVASESPPDAGAGGEQRNE